MSYSSRMLQLPCTAEAAHPFPVRILTILILDRGEHAAQLLHALRTHGMPAWSTGSAAEALDWTQTFDPDLVLVNADLPDLDACRFIAAFRAQNERFASVPAVVLTARPLDESGGLRYASHGFDVALSLPLNPDAVPRFAERYARKRTSVRRRTRVPLNVNRESGRVEPTASGCLFRAI